jgi:hypothetical protein
MKDKGVRGRGAMLSASGVEHRGQWQRLGDCQSRKTARERENQGVTKPLVKGAGERAMVESEGRRKRREKGSAQVGLRGEKWRRGRYKRLLNQKVGSKPSEAVDFASRFVFLINCKFKIRTFNNYYESRYKINDSRGF